MADEIVTNEETLETGAENNTGEKTVNEKLFKQADVDKVVRERLAREKANFKSIQDGLESEKSNLQTSIEAYENKLKELITPQLESVPDEYKELVEKLPLLEQVAFISKLSGKSQSNTKKFIPSTPQNNGEKNKQTVQKSIGTII